MASRRFWANHFAQSLGDELGTVQPVLFGVGIGSGKQFPFDRHQHALGSLAYAGSPATLRSTELGACRCWGRTKCIGDKFAIKFMCCRGKLS